MRVDGLCGRNCKQILSIERKLRTICKTVHISASLLHASFDRRDYFYFLTHIVEEFQLI